MQLPGILMPIASLPSRFGIGDFGACSYEFVDLIAEAGFQLWQILPLNPLGYGNSPYQPYSSYAGDEIYISLEILKKEERIKEIPDDYPENSHINYEAVRTRKQLYLREAFSNFKPDTEYEEFIKQEWVYPYAVYLTLKKQNHLVCWNEWPKEQKEWIKNRQYNLEEQEENIRYEMVIQYFFYRQWMQLKEYANQKGIRIMGDIPFYVGIDSLDVWANQECFLLDEDGYPTFIAGVPPDYFSKTGQRWGNPIYNWKTLKETGYQFWLDRLAYTSKIFDIIRIDHFRAFDTYWKIPSSCKTAIEGEWISGPGYDFFDTLLEKEKDISIIVEDLGDLRPQVHQLRDHYQLKGMKVLQFTFDPKENNNNFKDRENMVIYTGTHDNQTIRGWYESQKKEFQKKTRKQLKKMGITEETISWCFITMAFQSIAEIAIIPLQDFINLDDSGRINKPGTLGSPNWEWKLESFSDFKRQIPKIKKLIEMCIKK